MPPRSHPLRFFYTVRAGTALGVVLLAGCAARPVSGTFPAPYRGDDGVVIARTSLVPGVSTGNSLDGRTDDCSGPGLGVKVDGTTGGDNYLFDKNGEPCTAATTLFDGRNPVSRRQTDPAITLIVHDEFGPVPERDALPGLQPLPEIRLKSELLPSSGVEPAAGRVTDPATGEVVLASKNAPALPSKAVPAAPDPLVATLQSWEKQDEVAAGRTAEADRAAERNLRNISKDVQDLRDQQNMARLMAELRERERQVEEQQRRHADTLQRAEANRELTTAAREQWKQREQELQANLAATQERLREFEALSQRLNADKSAREKAYQEQISNLSADLKAAEAQADVSRRELVLQAAAKIAEAERLATAAQLQEQDIKLREAARLKTEAETMMDRALAIKAGNSVVVGGVDARPAVPLALMQTPIVLHATNQTLPDMLTTILNLAAPQAGQWKAEWQLSAASRDVLAEKWSLTAEAPVEQVLAQLQQQVKAAHGIALTFNQFAQSRLLVVTDVTPLTIEDAGK